MGAYGKTTVFGIFERNGQVYTEVVPDCKMKMLQGIIAKSVKSATVYRHQGFLRPISRPDKDL
jgi:transposase